MKAILDGIDVVSAYVPSRPLADGRSGSSQANIAEAKLAQLRGLQDKLLRFKDRACSQNNGIDTQKVEQLSQKVEGVITETELLKKLLNNAANDHGENICDRVFTNLDEFLANTDVCLTWGKGGDYESILNRIKTAFPQSRLIDLLDSKVGTPYNGSVSPLLQSWLTVPIKPSTIPT